MKQTLEEESKKNAATRKKLFRSVSELTTTATKLVSDLLRITKNVTKVGVSGSEYASRKIDEKLNK